MDPILLLPLILIITFIIIIITSITFLTLIPPSNFLVKEGMEYDAA